MSATMERYQGLVNNKILTHLNQSEFQAGLRLFL